MRIFLNAKLQYAAALRDAFALLVAHEFMPLTQTITQAIDTQTHNAQAERLDNQTKK